MITSFPYDCKRNTATASLVSCLRLRESKGHINSLLKLCLERLIKVERGSCRLTQEAGSNPLGD
jgi:hypothetical protein